MKARNMTVNDKPYLSTLEAAAYIGVSKSFLDKARVTGNVLIKYSKLGRRVVYRRADLDEYLWENLREHTGGKAGVR